MSAIAALLLAIFGVIALRHVRATLRLRTQFVELAASTTSAHDGVLPRGAGVRRLAAELAWAHRSDMPYGFVAMRTYGATARAISDGVLRRRRGHETVVEVDDRTLVVGVWDVDELGAARAAARLAAAGRDSQLIAIDVAVALAPHDGEDVLSLIERMAPRLASMEDVADAVAM